MTPADSTPAGASAASPPAWRLERQQHGRLDLVDDRGNRHADVDIVRAFPITAPTGSVSIIAADGDELAWIDSLETVDPALRRLLEDELAQRDFLPVIERIESVSDGEPAEWAVETDRGPRRFTVEHADDITRLPDGGAVITDTFAIRYTIRDLSRLDPRSRRLFEKSL
ncbi:MAG: DUF1854 domain-containing protein [Planctomycetia bacterium]|nr:DUF1854 domain-containing protein [Planctomycetia bacterium]